MEEIAIRYWLGPNPVLGLPKSSRAGRRKRQQRLPTLPMRRSALRQLLAQVLTLPRGSPVFSVSAVKRKMTHFGHQKQK